MAVFVPESTQELDEPSETFGLFCSAAFLARIISDF